MSAPEAVQVDASQGQPVDFEQLARIVISDSKVNCLTVVYLNGLSLELASFERRPVVNVGRLEPAYQTRVHALVDRVFGDGTEMHEEVTVSLNAIEGCSVIGTGRSYVEVDPGTRSPSELATQFVEIADALDCEKIVSVKRGSL